MRAFHPAHKISPAPSTSRKYLYGSERLESMGARVIIASGIAFSSPRITDILGFTGIRGFHPTNLLPAFRPTLNAYPSSFLRIWTWYFIVSSSPASRAEMQFRDASCSAELPYVLSVSLMATEIPHRDFSPRVPITLVVVQ